MKRVIMFVFMLLFSIAVSYSIDKERVKQVDKYVKWVDDNISNGSIKSTSKSLAHDASLNASDVSGYGVGGKIYMISNVSEGPSNDKNIAYITYIKKWYLDDANKVIKFSSTTTYVDQGGDFSNKPLKKESIQYYFKDMDMIYAIKNKKFSKNEMDNWNIDIMKSTIYGPLIEYLSILNKK